MHVCGNTIVYIYVLYVDDTASEHCSCDMMFVFCAVELVALGQEEEAEPPQPFRWRPGDGE